MSNNLIDMVRAIREFTGEGMLASKKALSACDGDPLLACGYLKYHGSLVNRKGISHTDWAKSAGASYAKDLRLMPDGSISRTGAKEVQESPGI